MRNEIVRDVFFVIGFGMLLAGLLAWDWRVALGVGGVVLMAVSIAGAWSKR